MNNKRYILTADSDKQVDLMEADTGQVIHTFTNYTFANAKKYLTDQFDLIHSKEKPLPQSWMNLDIKLGVSTTSIIVTFELCSR